MPNRRQFETDKFTLKILEKLEDYNKKNFPIDFQENMCDKYRLRTK